MEEKKDKKKNVVAVEDGKEKSGGQNRVILARRGREGTREQEKAKPPNRDRGKRGDEEQRL